MFGTGQTTVQAVSWKVLLQIFFSSASILCKLSQVLSLFKNSCICHSRILLWKTLNSISFSGVSSQEQHKKWCVRWPISAVQNHITKGKQKYQGMFKTQKSGNKTSSGEIGLNIRTHTSPKVGQDQVSGGVSVHCWHAAPVANVLRKPHIIR